MRAMRDSALQHWLAAGAPADITRAAALVERSGATLWAHGDLAAVREWLERLPEQAIYTRPWLAVWYAWALQSNSELEAVPGLLAAAEQGLANDGITDRQSLRGWIAAIRSHLARNHEEFDRAIALAQEALTEFPPGDHAGRIAAQWGLALAQHMRGDLRQALLSYGDTADLFTAARDTFLNGLMRCLQAHVLYEQAQLQAAAEPIRRLVTRAQQTAGEPAPGEATVPPVAGWALIERGRVAFARNDLTQAERLLHEGIALAQRGAIRDAVCVGYDALVRIGLAQGDAGGAQAAAESFTRMAEETQFPLYLEWASAVTARVRLAQGNVPAAVAWAVAHQPRPEALFYSHKVAYATFIRVLIAQQQFDEALRWIDRQLAPAERMGHVLTAIELHVLRAVAEQARGDTPAALDALDAALTLAAPEGITRLFLDEGPLLARLLAQSAARTGRSDKRYSFIRLLLLALPLASPAGAQAAELGLPVAPATAQAGDASVRGLFEPLTPREVEILRLIAAGRSTQEMAAELVVTAGTVKTHLHHLYGKLEARDRVHALIRARELGLIE
jgi:LuxR family maltose regulon positive regulatory protein